MKAILVLLTTTLAAATAQAQFYSATLTPAQDGGGARTGTGAFTLSLSGTTMTLSGTFSGLSGTTVAGHIHGPSDVFPASASPVYDFGPAELNILPMGVNAGSLSSTFELVTKRTGSYTVAQQLADLNAGRWYVNIHSTTFGGGEIRGQILMVPEPSTWLVGGLGMIGLLALRRSRRAA